MTLNLYRPKVAGPARTQPREVTRCKICRLAILAGQPTVWRTKPMGLSHETCAQGDVTIGT